MNQKIKNSIIIVISIVLVVGGALIYIFTVQKDKLDERDAKLIELN